MSGATSFASLFLSYHLAMIDRWGIHMEDTRTSITIDELFVRKLRMVTAASSRSLYHAPATESQIWLKSHIRRPPHWPIICPSGGSHKYDFHQAQRGSRNRPIDVNRFGEATFYAVLGLFVRETGSKGRSQAQTEASAFRQVYLSLISLSNLTVCAEPAALAKKTPPKKIETKKKAHAREATKHRVATAPKAQASEKAKAPADAAPIDAAAVSPDAKGKGKARADAVAGEIITSVSRFNVHHASEVELGFVEKDEYDTDKYEIEDDERRDIKIIAFTDANVAPIQFPLELRAVSHVEVSHFEASNVLDLGSNAYMWHCPLLNQWLALDDSPINLRPRGQMLILRNADLLEKECVDLIDRMEEVLQSVLALAEEDSDEEEHPFPFSMDDEADNSDSSLPESPFAVKTPRKSLKRNPSPGRQTGTVHTSKRRRTLSQEVINLADSDD
ncbi:hypothetical protein DFH09DRAFT_1289719 [Mycena vulgaris]|nr:hypothetical protein DFH09DRAFT_1289719 [Mycena vulgaris]